MNLEGANVQQKEGDDNVKNAVSEYIKYYVSKYLILGIHERWTHNEIKQKSIIHKLILWLFTKPNFRNYS